MSLNINEVYELVQAVSRDNGKGTIQPRKFNKLAKLASSSYFNYLFGLPDGYRPYDPVPNVAFQVSSLITDEMRRFIVVLEPVNVMPNNTFLKNVSFFPMPGNACRFIGAYRPNDQGYSEIETVGADIFSARTSSSFKKPTGSMPVGTLHSGGYLVSPDIVRSVFITYLRNPGAPSWAYIIANGAPVYNQGGSVDFDWPESSLVPITQRILLSLGINIRDEFLAQYGAKAINQ